MQPNGDMIQIIAKDGGHKTYTTKYNVVFFEVDETHVDAEAETTTKKSKG